MEIERTKSEEREVLQQVLDALAPVENEARNRIVKTVITFFDLDLTGSRVPIGDEIEGRGSQVERQPIFSGHRTISPKDFMLEKNPSTDVERVVCLAYYLAHYKGQRHFKTSDISMLNTEAAQRKLSNAAFAVNNAAQTGYFVPGPGGQKQLSAMGEQYVEALPDRAAAKAVLERFRHRRSRPASVAGKKRKQPSELSDS